MYKDFTAISIKDLSKMYKIYKSKRDKVLDILNINVPFNKNSYNEFWALKDINIEIKKGEKIGIIGRNGAGKSTLLKIITGNIKPTTGEVKINGKVSALLELGTGFHPEFTGRENIFASLAYMGIDKKEAERQYYSIVEFSELEEFIDKPIKTYSAGMYTRLAFSVATSIDPEILIIDEVLGAGDAYFLNKSIERMKHLTEGGTTVLFVSHDIASVQKMCNQAIWIDNGKIVMKGDTISVSKEYAYSIRQQEELRLRAKNLKIKQKQLKTFENSESKPLIGHFITDHGSPKEVHSISSIALYRNNDKLHQLNIGDAMDNDINRTLFLIINSETINWSNPLKIDGKDIRNFENLGGIYEHSVFTINLPNEDYLKEHPQYSLEVYYKDTSQEVVNIELYDGDKYVKIGEFENKADNQWKTSHFEINDNIYIKDNEKISDNCDSTGITSESGIRELINEKNEIDNIDRDKNDIYGSGETIITDVKFLDKEGNSKLVFTSGEGMICRIKFLARQFIYSPVFVVAIYKMDGTCISQSISNKDNFDVGRIQGKGYVDITFDPLLIGKGEYIVSVAIFKELNLHDPIEPKAYDLHDRKYQIKVDQPFGINVELGQVIHPIKWGVKYE